MCLWWSFARGHAHVHRMLVHPPTRLYTHYTRAMQRHRCTQTYIKTAALIEELLLETICALRLPWLLRYRSIQFSNPIPRGSNLRL
jgi:hypothetical protein